MFKPTLAFTVFILMSAVWLKEARAQTSAEITWRLENSFRYFKDSADTDFFRAEYAALTEEERKTPIVTLERRLSQKTEGWGWAERFWDVKNGFALKTEENVCWQQAKPCSDYVKPASHNVLARVEGISEPCVWLVAEIEAAKSDNCSQDVKIQIPFPVGARVEARFGTQSRIQDIKVTDLLAVGLGDSFASGEGNPDRAVRFDPALVTNYGGRRLDGFPARSGLKVKGNQIIFPANPKYAETRARWLNEPCHRSLYSHQLRAALQLALDDPKGRTSVTFLSAACTGSTILEGLITPWAGNVTSRGTDAVSQISGVSNAICGEKPSVVKPWPMPENKIFGNAKQTSLRICPQENARRIDHLMLSIGGNDIGFSSLIANAALRLDPGTAALAPLFGGNIRTNVEQAAQEAQSLPAKYRALAALLRDVLYIKKPAQVFLMAYPQMDFDEAGQVCTSGTRSMDVSSLFALNGDRAARLENFLEEQLTPIMKEATADTGWIFVEAHRREGWFRNRGVCALTAEEADKPALGTARFPRRISADKVSAFAEASAVPQQRPRSPLAPSVVQPAGYGLIQTAQASTKWEPFAPNDFRPYASRQRWFRTPNDAFLTAHHSDLKKLGGMEAITRFSAYSGAFHPTAEGQAAMADALFLELKKTIAPEPVETPEKPN